VISYLDASKLQLKAAACTFLRHLKSSCFEISRSKLLDRRFILIGTQLFTTYCTQCHVACMLLLVPVTFLFCNICKHGVPCLVHELYTMRYCAPQGGMQCIYDRVKDVTKRVFDQQKCLRLWIISILIWLAHLLYMATSKRRHPRLSWSRVYMSNCEVFHKSRRIYCSSVQKFRDCSSST
jgi:hypothetical protein